MIIFPNGSVYFMDWTMTYGLDQYVTDRINLVAKIMFCKLYQLRKDQYGRITKVSVL